MLTPIPLLQNARVASPCDASWEGMEAIDGERVKFCLHCSKNVYNLSAMTQAEAEGLLRKHEGKLCVRYYQRRDGTVLTRDCPVGAQAVRMALIRRSTVAAGLFTMLFSAMAAMNMTNQRTMGVMAVAPQVPQPVAGEISIAKPEPPHPVMMGAVAVRPIMGDVAPVRERSIQGQIAFQPPKNTHKPKHVNKPAHKAAETHDSTDAAILKPRPAE